METVNKENKKKSFNFSLIDNTSPSIPAGNITFILSFCIPALIFLALYYLRDIFPFGNDCYLRSDMYHQYAPFYSELWHKLRTGDTLLYSGISAWGSISHHFLHIHCKSHKLAYSTAATKIYD